MKDKGGSVCLFTATKIYLFDRNLFLTSRFSLNKPTLLVYFQLLP